MRYRIVLPAKMAADLKKHILSDRSKEQMAIVLCGLNHLKDEIRLLGRHLILLPPEAFLKQSSAYLEILPEVQRHILRLAAQEGLSQIDLHSHPGNGSLVSFSSIDDHHEKELAQYLIKKVPGTYYASVVMNDEAIDARIWETNGSNVHTSPVHSIKWGDFNEEGSSLIKKIAPGRELIDDRFSRQVMAFGSGLQERLETYRVGVIGLGGIGGIMAEMLGRLGVQDWGLLDDDIVEISNLNRLPGSTLRDAYYKTLKVRIAQRNIVRVNPFARIKAWPCNLTNPKILQALKSFDLLVVATDNHSSRMIANRLSNQYLIPLIHVGVNIDVDEERKITDISGEFVMPSLGEWCLQCAGIIDSQAAGWELAREEVRTTLKERGYIKDTPAPAVYHLNGVIASLAVAEIHNSIYPYKPIRRYLTYDELKGELLSLDIQPKDDCPLCGAEGGVLGLGDLEPLPDYMEKERPFPRPDQFKNMEFGEEESDSFPETILEGPDLSPIQMEEFRRDRDDT